MTIHRDPARRRAPLPRALTTVLVAVLAVGCTTGGGSGNEPEASGSPPHGHVEGARESAEQQARLVLSDPVTGDARVLDLITEKVHRVEGVAGATALTTDGRFGYVHAPAGVSVIDTGAWMVDHGDHVHYYRADLRTLGRLTPHGDARVSSGDGTHVAVTTGRRGTVLHRRGDLEQGRIGAGRPLAGRHAAVIPFRAHVVAVPRAAGAGVTVLDRAGKETASLKAECRDPRGEAVTRRGVVLGCADGALLVRARGEEFTAVKIPYPQDVPPGERARDFRLRPGSDTLTALAGDTSVWVLDVTDRVWKRVETGPVLAANTAGEGAPLLALGTDGTLRGFDVDTGERTAQAALRALPARDGIRDGIRDGVRDGVRAGDAGAPDIAVDQSRAYVSNPAAKRVDEIDYNDSLRVARSFDLDIRPGLMVETGR
ncbi:hypothetical protein [Streptomyces sp. NPDC005955]|uniref:hypothetical protein n=1 Tax=Streptomyces sp. NPDC005955 TaxID=3364738 RepID=UPI0036A2B906